MLNHYVLFKN